MPKKPMRDRMLSLITKEITACLKEQKKLWDEFNRTDSLEVARYNLQEIGRLSTKMKELQEEINTMMFTEKLFQKKSNS